VENLAQIEKWVSAPRLVGVELNPGPGSGEHLTTKERWEIVISSEEKNPNYSQIAKKIGCTRPTVKAVLQKYKETGTVDDRAGRGRKRKCSEAEVKAMVRKAKKGKFAPEIARESKKVAVRTVQKYLRESPKVQWLKIKQIEKLSEAHKKKRVEYSERMDGYNWNKVLFSDEKTFFLGASPGWAWQDPKNRIVEEKTPYPKKLNVWGAIGTHMKTKLYYFDSNLNSELYSAILRSRIQEKDLIYSPKCPKNLPKHWVFCKIMPSIISRLNPWKH